MSFLSVGTNPLGHFFELEFTLDLNQRIWLASIVVIDVRRNRGPANPEPITSLGGNCELVLSKWFMLEVVQERLAGVFIRTRHSRNREPQTDQLIGIERRKFDGHFSAWRHLLLFGVLATSNSISVGLCLEPKIYTVTGSNGQHDRRLQAINFVAIETVQNESSLTHPQSSYHWASPAAQAMQL